MNEFKEILNDIDADVMETDMNYNHILINTNEIPGDYKHDHESVSKSDSKYTNLATLIPIQVMFQNQNGTYELDQSVLDNFGLALRKNVLFDVGFHIETHHKYDRKYNWCPLSNRYSKWKTTFGLLKIEQCDCIHKSFTPEGLMTHLRNKMKDCFYHRFVHTYLTNLYLDYYGIGYPHQIHLSAKSWDKFRETHLKDCLKNMNDKIPVGPIAYGKIESPEKDYSSDLQKLPSLISNTSTKEDKLVN